MDLNKWNTNLDSVGRLMRHLWRLQTVCTPSAEWSVCGLFTQITSYEKFKEPRTCPGYTRLTHFLTAQLPWAVLNGLPLLFWANVTLNSLISLNLIWLRSCDKSESHNLSSQSPTSLFWNTKQFYFHRWAFDALRTLLTYCPHFLNTFRFFYLLSNRLHSRPPRCRCLIYLTAAFKWKITCNKMSLMKKMCTENSTKWLVLNKQKLDS